MKTVRITILSFLLTVLPVNGYAAVSGVAVGAKVGTTGMGVEARTPMMGDNMYIRIGLDYLQYKFANNLWYKGLLFHGTTKMSFVSTPLMLDYHPVDDSGFRLSVGVAYNVRELKSVVRPHEKLNLPERSISVKSTLGNKIAPVISVGYDGSFKVSAPWSFNAEVGLMYLGKAKLSLSHAGFKDDEIKLKDFLMQSLKNDLKRAKKYMKVLPVISIGCRYSF